MDGVHPSQFKFVSMVNTETQFSQTPVPISQTETDQLLEQVSEQLAHQTFDPDNAQQLTRLVESLGDSRGMTRLRVAETLGSIGTPACTYLQTALIHHGNVVVRRASAKTLTLIANPESIPTLLQALLNDADTVVKGSSVAALAKMGEAAVPRLLEILESPVHPASIKGHAAWALAFIGAPAQPYLAQALTSDAAEVRMAVVGAIAKVAEDTPDPTAGELLLSALDDSASMVRSEAAVALSNLGYQPALPKLVPLLSHSDWETRKAAALALMKLGNADGLPALQTRLADETNGAVQKVLELAIMKLEQSQAEEDW